MKGGLCIAVPLLGTLLTACSLLNRPEDVLPPEMRQCDGGRCSDVDPCGACDEVATCQVSGAGARCACPATHVDADGDGTRCVENGRCTANIDCGPHGVCDMGGGEQLCRCRAGYRREEGRCTDIDECATGSDDCDRHARCTNEAGSFTCACAEGFDAVGDGRFCRDIDECEQGSDRCGENAACVNSEGAYECNCAPGYEGNPRAGCEDTDECARGQLACTLPATCSARPGPDRCACPVYYDDANGDGSVCADYRAAFHLAFDSGSPAGSYIATPYAEEDSPLALVIAGSFVGSVKAFCGEELSAGATYADVFVAGLDGQHRCRWARAFGSAGSDQVLDTIIGRDGGPLLLAALDDEARLDGVELPGPSCMLLKFDHKGVLDWNVRLPGCAVGAGDQPLVRPALPDALAVDEAGNFYVAQGLQDAATIGATVLPKPLAQALLVLKVSAAGAPTWAAVFGPESAPSRLYPHTISVAPDGHVYVLGHADGTFALPGGGTRPGPAWFVAALDPAGSTRWIQLYPDGSAPIADLAAHAGGVYALLASASSGPMQIAVQSLSLEGREVWRSELGDGVVSPLEIEVDRSGRAFVAGDAAEPATIGDESATGSTQIFLVSLEPDGRVAWSHVYGPQAPPPDAWLGLADLAVGPNDLLYVVTAGRELEPSVAAFQR